MPQVPIVERGETGKFQIRDLCPYRYRLRVSDLPVWLPTSG
jgi:hypothetical protein